MNFATYLGYTVVLVLVIVAGLCFFSPKENALFAGKNNILLGCLFLVYAAFRLYRIRQTAKRNSQ